MIFCGGFQKTKRGCVMGKVPQVVMIMKYLNNFLKRRFFKAKYLLYHLVHCTIADDGKMS